MRLRVGGRVLLIFIGMEMFEQRSELLFHRNNAREIDVNPCVSEKRSSFGQSSYSKTIRDMGDIYEVTVI